MHCDSDSGNSGSDSDSDSGSILQRIFHLPRCGLFGGGFQPTFS
jgi:hypothetical protein